MAKKLLLLRHGATGREYQGRYLGGTDVPLGPEGGIQIQGIAGSVKALQPEICLCSPMDRCRKTVEILFKNTATPVEYHDDLREIDFGQWEGLTFPEIAGSYPEHVRQWADGTEDFIFPGGEAIAHFQHRIGRAAGQIEALPHETILVCTHGGVIRALIAFFLKLTPRQFFLFKIDPGTLTSLEIENSGGILTGLNDPLIRRKG